MWIRETTAGEQGVKGGYVTTTSGQVHYRTTTQTTGAPVLMLHQSPLSSAQYRGVIPALAARGFRAFAIDTPGHGCSFTPQEEWDIEQYADVIIEVSEALGFDEILLFGRATGGTIAVETARRAPALVKALGIHGLPVYTLEERLERLEDFAPPIQMTADGLHVEGVWDRIMGQYPELEPALATQFLIEYLGSGPDYARAYRAVFRYDMPERFPDVTCPVRVWFSEHDRLSFMKPRPRGIDPDLDQLELPGQDDFIAWRAPEQLAEAIAAFFERFR
jgi:pimeloyl-ACP methyl ester carboxylesterase